MERALMCPQCNAPLAPNKFARSVVCSYCGATIQLDESFISAKQFQDAFQAWNSPASYALSSWLSLGDSHWMLEEQIAHGDISDVYRGQRARWPTELAIIKLLRDRQYLPLFENEWQVLQELQGSAAPGAETFVALLPQPIVHGDINDGSNAGQSVSIFRWASGFRHTFEEVLRAYPQGIPPRASIWVWRRILEILSFLHNSGIVHGAVLPSHLLVQESEHGVRLVGYSAAGHVGERLSVVSDRYEIFYPRTFRFQPVLSVQLDLIMSARCILTILGGDPQTGSLPMTVPPRLARLIRDVALMEVSRSGGRDTWSLREELGVIAQQVFGSPQFIPIVMPS